MNSDFCVAVHALVYLNRRGCVLSSEELPSLVSTSWHSGSQEVKCLVATGMAQVMDALFDDLDDRCMARLEEITVEQVDRKLSGGPCPGGG